MPEARNRCVIIEEMNRQRFRTLMRASRLDSRDRIT